MVFLRITKTDKNMNLKINHDLMQATGVQAAGMQAFGRFSMRIRG